MAYHFCLLSSCIHVSLESDRKYSKLKRSYDRSRLIVDYVQETAQISTTHEEWHEEARRFAVFDANQVPEKSAQLAFAA
jgi:hypothetical protein